VSLFLLFSALHLKAKKKDISDAAHDGPKSGESWEKKSASSPERIPSSLAPVMTPPWFLGFQQQQQPSLILFLSFLMSPRIAKWRLWSVRRNHLTSSTSIRLIVFQQRRYIATSHFFFFPAHTHCHGQFKKIHTRDSHCLSVDFHIQIRQAPVILRVDFLKRRKNRSFKYSTARQNCSCCVVTPSLFDPFNGITQKNMSISDRFTSNLVFHRKRTIDLEQKQNSR
jgi:hypothetical protein